MYGCSGPWPGEREYAVNDQDVFFDSQIVQYAVIRNWQILAESTQWISDLVKATDQHVPWREIASFRNVLAYDYSENLTTGTISERWTKTASLPSNN